MINRIVLVGRLCADPELRTTQTGLPVAKFTVAVDRNYKNASGERDTDFIRCVAWRKQAELIGQYMKKGRMLGIDGSLQSSRYETSSGEKRTSHEVVIDQLQFIGNGKKKDESSQEWSSPPPQPKPANSADPKSPSDDDLPF